MPAPELPSRNPRHLPDVYRPLWQQGGSWARRQLIRALGSLETQLDTWLLQLEQQQAAEPNRVTLKSLAVTAIARFWLGGLRYWRLWNTALVRIKQRVPGLRGVPNGVLTLGVVLLLAGIIGGAIALWPQTPSKPPEPAAVSTPEATPPASSPTPVPPNLPSTLPTAPILPEEPPPVATPAPTPTPAETSPSTAVEPTPLDALRPETPEPEASGVPPAAVLTFEQRLLSQLQAQLKPGGDRPVNRPAADLLQSVQITGTKLVARLAPTWRLLSGPDQDAFADQLQDLSQEQGFERLELVDAQGQLLARSPVVGDRMVILRRS